MKRKNLKPIIISALTAVAFGALSVGTTFALFTDDAETSISIGSGKVKVGLATSNLKLYSADSEDHELGTAGTIASGPFAGTYYYKDVTTGGNFTNGGSASLEGNVLTLSKVTPGDKVSFDVALSDESNVNFKYRLVLNTVKAEGEADKFLARGLEVTTNLLTGESATYQKLEKYVSNWATHTYSSTDPLSGTYHFDITLPLDAGNEYQDKKVEYYFSVEAVQGNAKTNNDDAGTFYFLADQEEVVINTATVLEAANSDNSIKVKTTIPADGGLTAGQKVDLVVSSLDVQTGTESTTLNFDVSLFVDGEKATSFNGKSIAVEVKLPTNKDIISVTHNGEAVTAYTYNKITGTLSFNTTTFSPFSVVYKEHEVHENDYFPDNYTESIDGVTYTVHEVNSFAAFQNISTYLTTVALDTEKPLFRITQDIDISSLTAPLSTFRGVLEGNNHRLYGTNASLISGYKYVGIFSKVGKYEIIQDSKTKFFTDYADTYKNLNTVVFKDLVLDNVHVSAENSRAGLLFGASALEEGADGVGYMAEGTSIVVKNITVNDNCSVEGNGNMGSICGKTDCVEKVTFDHITTSLDINNNSNNGAGSICAGCSYATTLTVTNCIGTGDISGGTYHIGGLIGSANGASKYVVHDNIVGGTIRMTGSGGNAGFTIGTYKTGQDISEVYNNQVLTSSMLFVGSSLNSVYDKTLIEAGKVTLVGSRTFAEAAAIGANELSVLVSPSGAFDVTPLSGAAYYKGAIRINGKTLSISSNKATIINNGYPKYTSESYETVDELEESFHVLNRMGYITNDAVDTFIDDLSGSGAYSERGRMNFYRVSGQATGATKVALGSNLNKVTKLGDDWVYVTDEDSLAISPVGSYVDYYIYAYDSNNVAIGVYHYQQNEGSSTVVKNMHGDDYSGSTDYSASKYYEYAA